ncbi:MAG: hypothetical protein E7165_02580 [Firmicutes bacterium]|nr:hypothetical protein [Bacillota bacterium]
MYKKGNFHVLWKFSSRGGENMKYDYEINSSTLAIISIDDFSCKVLEEEAEYIVNKPSFDVIDDSCKYFGSSYKGRYEGTKSLIGMNYKLPIIIEESRNIIFFPTSSPQVNDCCWISLNKISDYYVENDNVYIFFKNHSKLKLNISFFTLENQILRASRLESVLRHRKNNENK